MTGQSFSLIPFPSLHVPEISISGHILRTDEVLSLHFMLGGNIDEVLLPPRSAHPARKDELWKATCFECFLAIQGQPGYWEFNMSPSGDWNIYRMEAYRRLGFRQEAALQGLPFDFRKEQAAILLDANVPLDPIVPRGSSLDVGIAAIVQTEGGIETYWALTHPAAQADFHLRESFTLVLEARTHLAEQSAPVD